MIKQGNHGSSDEPNISPIIVKSQMEEVKNGYLPPISI